MGAYIFLGPELGKKNEAVKAVKENIAGNAEEFVFYADETPASTIANTLLNQSLFSDARIIIVKNAEIIKKKEDIDLLVSCTKDLEKNTALIFLSDEIKLAAGFDNAKANKQVFYEMFERDKIDWLRSFFKKAGFYIEKDCIDTILEMVENNTDALSRECSRLISFLPKGKEISIDDIEKWLSHNREESAFTLFSRIARGDLLKSLESLKIMLAAKESAQSILAGLAWCYRKLGDYLLLAENGNENNSFELKKIGLSSPTTRDDYAAASRIYNEESVEKCLALTAQYDMLLRSPVSVMENILLDRYILAVINTGKRKY
ncbi:MAG: DNA polymerase III subunit delta [Treponema sp.]|nr:DNA polymerase III subunit delta [Treponema sp.]MCL2250572.1 DNA polymerase III subunit delta [Treponema sp.]